MTDRHPQAPDLPPSPPNPPRQHDFLPDDPHARPDRALTEAVFELVVSLRGWAEVVKAARARRYDTNPGSPGAINLGEVEKALRQCANLADQHTELLGRDLRR